MKTSLSAAALLLFILAGCGEETVPDNAAISGDSSYSGEIWSARDTLRFSLPEGSEHFLAVTGGVATNGEIFYLLDQSDRQFLAFSREGRFLSALGGSGKGPGENGPMIETYVDREGRLYVADNRQLRVNIFGSDRRFIRSAGLRYQVNDFAVQGDRIYTFSHHSQYKFGLYNLEGELLTEAFQPDDQSQSIFLVTRRTGGIAWDPEEERLFGLYPDAFRIHVLDAKLDTLGILEAVDGNAYRTPIPEFPDNLDPYGSSDAHWEYWNSFNHITGLYYAGDDILIVAYARRIDPEKWDYEYYLNGYRLNGDILFEGIGLPGNNRIAAFAGGQFYFNISDASSDTLTLLKTRLQSF